MKLTEHILTELGNVVRSTFPDRDFPEDADGSTRVFADLGMASIDLVVLAEKLESYYGKRLPFGVFLKDLRDRGADDIELRELVAFLQIHG